MRRAGELGLHTAGYTGYRRALVMGLEIQGELAKYHLGSVTQRIGNQRAPGIGLQHLADHNAFGMPLGFLVLVPHGHREEAELGLSPCGFFLTLRCCDYWGSGLALLTVSLLHVDRNRQHLPSEGSVDGPRILGKGKCVEN